MKRRVYPTFPVVLPNFDGSGFLLFLIFYKKYQSQY